VKLVSLTRVKIDGDVIEEFVRHTARYVDELVIVDNASPDAARQTLLDLQAEGLPITLLEDDFIEMRLDTIETYAREVFARSNPDYLLPLDADEFLRAESREALEAKLTALPSPGYAKVCWVTYVPTKNEDRSEERILARMRYHLAREIWPTEKVFLPRHFGETTDVKLIPGAHGVLVGDGTQFPATMLADVTLAHFPVRSLTQIQSKVLLGWSAALAAGYDLVPGYDDKSGMGIQWRKLYEKLRAGVDWSEDEFYRAAANYFGDAAADIPELIYDPLIPVERRHTPKERPVLSIAVDFARQLARAHAKLTKRP